jgi:hypothetical protein
MDQDMKEYLLRNGPLIRNPFGVFEEEEYSFKCSNRQWQIYKGDGDDWPSKPHAHDVIGGGQKLDLRNGDLYSPPSWKYAGKLPKKEFAAVRRYFTSKGVALPKNA